MSLFPAFLDQTNDNFISQDNENNPEWLKNSSYKKISERLLSKEDHQDNVYWSDSSSLDEEIHEDVIILPSSSNNKQIKTTKKQRLFTKNDVFYQDKSKNKSFCLKDTLDLTQRPNYNLSKYQLNFKHRAGKNNKYKKFQRYYLINLEDKKKLKKKNSKQKDSSAVIIEEEEKQSVEFENKAKKITEEFNKKLADCPNDIDTWLDYLTAQDDLSSLQMSLLLTDKKKKKFLIAVSKKKLSIVEKGLTSNPNSMVLLKKKLQIMSELVPIDQFVQQIETLLQKDFKNITLWQYLITTVQTSLTLCKISKVLNLYTKFFPILKQKTKTNPKFYEKQILEVLYQCLIFLRNAGLWEHMWEIVRYNLCLNLTLDQKLLEKIQTIDEKTLMSMEELVLTSKLPLDQLWLRVELLRENCHWISVVNNDDDNYDISLIGDEKRLVTSDDIGDFIYPTIRKESNFQLVVSLIFSLKVPLLPTRHSTLKDFNLDQHCWGIDSLEFLLPMIYSTIWSGELLLLDNSLTEKNFIKDLLDGKLTSGPQCVKYHPAKESFLNFIRTVFETTSQNLPVKQKTSIIVWWLKFERLIIFLTKYDSSMMDDQLLKNNFNSNSKKIKAIVKNLLKKPELKNNLHIYREFALIERERLDDNDIALNILKTAIFSQTIDNNDDDDDKITALFSIYRTIFEITLNTTKNYNLHVEEVAENMKIFISTIANYDSTMPLEDMLYNEILKFLMTTTTTTTNDSEDAFLLPNRYCDTLFCYALYLLLKFQIKKTTTNDDDDDDDNNTVAETMKDILDLFDKCLSHCDDVVKNEDDINNCSSYNRLKERFYELKIVILQIYCNYNNKNLNDNYFSMLRKTVSTGLYEFSNNFHLLSVNGFIETTKLPFWQIKALNPQNNNNLIDNNAWTALAKCLAFRARIANIQKIDDDNTSVLCATAAAVNKTLSYHKTITGMKRLQDCPLIWKFYMLLLREHNLCEKKGEEIYYEAVNQCSWSRSVYMSAAEVAPQILAQIQDLMKEKEIRIHVTPEELEILRE